MLENFQGDSWGSIPPLRMPSLLPHDLCHGLSVSRWLPAVIEFQLNYYRSSLNMQYAGSQQTFVGKVKSLLFNMLSRFVIAFLPKSKHLLISWLQSPSAVILEPKKRKSVTASTFSPSICHEVMGLDAKILVFLMVSFKPAFSLSSFTLIKRFFSSSSLYAFRVVSSAYLRLLTFLSAILIPACDSFSLAYHMMCSE